MNDVIQPAARGVRSAPARGCCPACNSSRLTSFYRLSAMPTNSCILLDDAASAEAYPTGEIELVCCDDCGFIHNRAFDAGLTEYSGRYEETQGFSPTFSAFHRRLAEGLVEKHDLRGKRILEIGCGEGDFLVLLAEIGGNAGVGVDPIIHPDRIDSPVKDRLTFHKEFYDADKHGGEAVDFVACKMTLEHIEDVRAFLTEIRRGLGEQRDAVVFFQVPETLRILREAAFEDVHYEHCSYFTPGSLARAFREAGFEVRALATEYADQYLTIEARVAPVSDEATPSQTTPLLPLEDDLAEIKSRVAEFPDRVAEVIADRRALVADAHAAGERIVIWGSGSKAVAFIAALGVGDMIHSVVDINPYKHGAHMPKSAQRIVSPQDLTDIKPDLVIVMNRIYEAEIKKDLSALGLEPRVICL